MCNGACRNHGVLKTPMVIKVAEELGLEVVTLRLDELVESPVPPEMDPLPEQLMYRPFFDLVAPKDNWKNPIYARIKAPQGREDRKLFKQMIERAVEFFAGCAPLIEDFGGEKITVRAVGYYQAVGA